MNDYVSREAVFQVVRGIARGIADRDIDVLKAKDMKAFYEAKGAKDILDLVDTYLCHIPDADVQPVVHSRWIPTGDGTYNAYCENCGQERYSKSWNKNDFTYCFGCGARMGGDTKGCDPLEN